VNSPGDPTPRTIDQVRQAIAALREVFEAKFSGYDKAIDLLGESANRQPTPDQLSERLQAMGQRVGDFEKLVEMRFKELDLRTNAVAVSDKKALDAAFQAAKEQFSSLELRISDVKDRVVGMEAGALGSRQGYAGIFTAISLAAAVVGAIVAIVMAVSS
jgi:hypothetical protein